MGETIGRVGWRTFGSAAPTSSYLLDTYGGASTAYSLRKLSSTYTGSAIRVRRSSDNTEQNIGFDESGNLDTTSLLAFVGSGNGFVTTWYNQSGVNHAIQSIASDQPQIVLSGVINKINNKPAVKFDGYSSLNLTTPLIFNNSGNLISFVGKRNSSGVSLYSLAGSHYLLTLFSDNYYYLQSNTNGYQVSTAPDTTTNQLLLSGVNNGTSQAMYKNNSVVSSTLVNYSLDGYINTIGRYQYGAKTDSSLQEIIYYNTENSSNLNGINTNINSYYSIYYVAPTPTYTARTSAFATATGITDTTILNALNTFDTGLISNGLDTKMKALYPFVGGTASTHKYNFMDPRDVDAAYRLVFSGGWVHSSTGAKPNGTNGYADTRLNASIMTPNSEHLSNYSRRKTNSGGLELGFISYTSGRFSYVMIQHGSGNRYVAVQGNDVMISSASTTGEGLTISNRRDVSKVQRYLNDSKLESSSGGNGVGGLNYYLASINGTGWFGSCEMAFGSIGLGLTDVEASALYTLVNAFQTSLSRAV
jgi:hypothetical protein